MTRPIVVDPGWSALLSELDVRPADVLRAARLPEDLFTRPRPSVSADGFFRLFGALAEVIDHDAPGLIMGQAVSSDVFSPPVLAAFCSEDLTAAAQRLSQYKCLVGPLKLEAHPMAGGLEVTMEAEPGVELPDEFVAAELVFLVWLARSATRHAVRPIAVEMTRPPNAKGYSEFFGTPVRPGPFNRVVFSPSDARRPFRSADPALFTIFEEDLRPRLDELDRNASLAERVRSVLMEALPGGHPDVPTVARRLGMSARTLQRQLGKEETSFQDVLQGLRERLARGYLAKSALTSPEIAFLLGYDDPNSFTRAFHGWTGTTPEALRRRLAAA
mgnify:FL=1